MKTDAKTTEAPKRRTRKPAKRKPNPFESIAADSFPKLNPKQVDRAARRLVLVYAEKDGLSGQEKHSKVAAELAKQLDELLVWPGTAAGRIGEAVDGPVLGLIAGFFVKYAHDALKGAGKI